MIKFLKEGDFPFCFRVRRLVPSRQNRILGVINKDWGQVMGRKDP